MQQPMSSELPPGFRFHPTDEELIMHYLRNQALSRPCPVSIIPEVNIYKFDPWELPDMSNYLGEGEWYFFTPRDRKYPNGARPNRATGSGYWKATGTDKAIHSKSRYVGVKKALVFYKGRPPKGTKTDWIMHEYRLTSSTSAAMKPSTGSMRLDDWVLCRIYQKKHLKRVVEDITPEDSSDEPARRLSNLEQPALRFPRSCSLAHLLEAEYMSISQMLMEYPFDSSENSFHAIASTIDSDAAEDMFKFHPSSSGAGYQVTNPTKSRGNPNLPFNQQNFVDPIFQY